MVAALIAGQVLLVAGCGQAASDPEVECVRHSEGQLDHITQLNFQGDFLQDDGKGRGIPIGEVYRGQGSLGAVQVYFTCNLFDDGTALFFLDPFRDPPPADDATRAAITADAAEEESEDEFFTGVTSVEVIIVNQVEMEIPTGLRIPEGSLVTHSNASAILIADEDPTGVNALINSSAAEAGYEVFAAVASGKVFVGHGNAVLFTSAPNAQMISWGPESMKDVLAQV